MFDSIIAETQCGHLKGVVQHSFEGYDYCAFKGIPYAKPPIGELRFRDPIPAEKWCGLRDASNYGPMCTQMDAVLTLSVQGAEDCLYLNVYSKSIYPNEPLPVMVWFHGGSFMYGSGDDLMYGPDYLLKKDIVLVTINYRVGILGFLDLDDEVAPGNQGLKDQVQALRWIQENIKNFGGDKSNVTIFGSSAGGVAVHYLALSPLTKGLFHKAISQSGVACNPWACSANKEYVHKLCGFLGNNSRDPKKLVEFLRTIDCKELIKAQSKVKFPEDKLRCVFPFGPGVDSKSKEPFMPIHPLEAMKKGVQVPYIMGCTNREGIFILEGVSDKTYIEINDNFEKSLNPITTKILNEYNTSPSDLRFLYYGDEDITKNSVEKFVDFHTDVHIVEGIHRTLKNQVEKSSAPTYLYQFRYDKEFSFLKTLLNCSLSGAAHYDEVPYLFSMRLYDKIKVNRFNPGTEGYKIIERMVELWTNFAKYGRPTPEVNDVLTSYWLPVVDGKVFRTLIIDEGELRMEDIPNLEERLSLRTTC